MRYPSVPLPELFQTARFNHAVRRRAVTRVTVRQKGIRHPTPRLLPRRLIGLLSQLTPDSARATPRLTRRQAALPKR